MDLTKFEIPSCDKSGCVNFTKDRETCWLNGQFIFKWIDSQNGLVINKTCQLVIQIKKYKTRQLISGG